MRRGEMDTGSWLASTAVEPGLAAPTEWFWPAWAAVDGVQEWSSGKKHFPILQRGNEATGSV